MLKNAAPDNPNYNEEKIRLLFELLDVQSMGKLTFSDFELRMKGCEIGL